MSYTIYRNVKVLSIEQQEVQPMRRTRDIVDPVRIRENYYVTVARFSGVDYEATIAPFKKYFQPHHEVSVAINDKWQVIAVINHTTGKEACFEYKTAKFSEIFGILFFLAIPSVLSLAIARLAFRTEKYHDYGWWVLGAGVLIVALVLYGVSKSFIESKQALREMRRQ